MNNNYEIYNENSLNLNKYLKENSIDCVITDPPYGINFKNNEWDKNLPDINIWKKCYKILKPGSYMLVFSFPRIMHRIMFQLEEIGFEIKDVLFWVYLNRMPKNKNIGLEIDKELSITSKKIGEYKYIQGYQKNKKKNYKTKKDMLTPISELEKNTMMQVLV